MIKFKPNKMIHFYFCDLDLYNGHQSKE